MALLLYARVSDSELAHGVTMANLFSSYMCKASMTPFMLSATLWPALVR